MELNDSRIWLQVILALTQSYVDKDIRLYVIWPTLCTGGELNGRLNKYLITEDANLREEWHQLLKKCLKDKYIEETGNTVVVENGNMQMIAMQKTDVKASNGVTNGVVNGVSNGATNVHASQDLDNDNVVEAATSRDK